jgi:hypothetical protein
VTILKENIGTNRTIQQNASEGNVWNERIIAAYLNPTDLSLYYAPASGNKSTTNLAISVYSNPSPSTSSNWVLLASFNWNGDTSIDQNVRMQNGNHVLWINPSKFPASWRSVVWGAGGFDDTSLNKKSPIFLAMESEQAIANLIPDWASFENIDTPNTKVMPNSWKNGYYNLNNVFTGTTEAWKTSNPIAVTEGSLLKFYLKATAEMAEIFSCDSSGNIIKRLKAGIGTTATGFRVYALKIPKGVTYLSVSSEGATIEKVYYNTIQEWLRPIFDEKVNILPYPNDWISGYYINRNGIQSVATGYNVTDYIDISNNNIIYLTGE